MATSAETAPRSRSSQTSRTPNLKPRGPNLFGIVATVAVALLLAADLARLTVASAEAEGDPALAAWLAPGIPPSLVSLAMAEVGQAAATARDPGPDTLERLRIASARAPLQPEPFLVEAALAQRNGQLDRAEALLKQARLRNPRSAAARYLLADVWLRQGKLMDALGELAVLSSIVPSSTVQLVPALSDYAKTPGARGDLERVLRINPRLKRPLLNALAVDPSNADLILALAGPGRTADAADRDWQARLLQNLVRKGEYDRAYGIWRGFAGTPERTAGLIFNASFRRSNAPLPFNWSYSSTAAGFAEPADGRLRVLYYGRDNARLAGQLLLLDPGSYRFGAPASGDAGSGSLQWTVTCVPGGQQIMRAAAGGGAAFEVPAAGCRAQSLELIGRAQEMPSDVDVRIGPARLERVGE